MNHTLSNIVNELKEQFKDIIEFDFVITKKYSFIGQATYNFKTGSAMIEFSRVWLERTNFNEDFIREVMLHEIAHLITNKRYGRVKAHGKEWKHVCRQIGANPRATVDVTKYGYTSGVENTTKGYYLVYVSGDYKMERMWYYKRKVSTRKVITGKPETKGNMFLVEAAIWNKAVSGHILESTNPTFDFVKSKCFKH